MSLDSLYSATQPLMSTAEDIWTPTRRLGSGGPRQPTLPPGQPAAQNTARSSVTPAYNAYSRAATTATATWKYLRLVRKVRTPSGSARPSKRPTGPPQAVACPGCHSVPLGASFTTCPPGSLGIPFPPIHPSSPSRFPSLPLRPTVITNPNQPTT